MGINLLRSFFRFFPWSQQSEDQILVHKSDTTIQSLLWYRHSSCFVMAFTRHYIFKNFHLLGNASSIRSNLRCWWFRGRCSQVIGVNNLKLSILVYTYSCAYNCFESRTSCLRTYYTFCGLICVFIKSNWVSCLVYWLL